MSLRGLERHRLLLTLRWLVAEIGVQPPIERQDTSTGA